MFNIHRNGLSVDRMRYKTLLNGTILYLVKKLDFNELIGLVEQDSLEKGGNNYVKANTYDAGYDGIG